MVTLNFILGGGGAGFYIIHTLTSMLIKTNFDSGLILTSEWLAILLVSAGLASVGLEAVRPLRMRFVFNRIRTSWISMEAFLALVFILFCYLQWRWPHAALQAIGVACAAGFMATQGFILYASKAVPAWNSPVILPLIMSLGFYAGCGLNIINHSFTDPVNNFLPAITLIFGIADLGIWRIYLRSIGRIQTCDTDHSLPSKGFEKSFEKISFNLLQIGVLVLCALTAVFFEKNFISPFLSVLTGVGIFLYSSLCKWRVVNEMGVQREIEMSYRESMG